MVGTFKTIIFILDVLQIITFTVVECAFEELNSKYTEDYEECATNKYYVSNGS